MGLRKSSKRSAPETERDRSRQRRRRTAFTDEQMNRLEDSFETEKFPGIQIREDLAKELNIGEDRIQVWFQNRRARWRKHEIRNKPAPVFTASNTLPNNSDVISPPAMFQLPSATFPPLSHTYVRAWSPVYPPFPVNTSMFPPSGAFKPAVFNRNSNFPSAASQTVSVLVRPRVSASASPPFSLSTSPVNNFMSQNQASCESVSGQSRHTVDNYLAAVTLASGFQREN